MARPRRIQFAGGSYHVTGRGNNRQNIFIDDQDREMFLELLNDAASRFSIQVMAFCLMNNHYHLFLSTPEANLSSGLHWLNCVYTMRFNRRHSRTGHLFQGRYKSMLVRDNAHWLNLSVYIHLNPVRANITDNPSDYKWSSFLDYTSKRSRYPWLMPERVLALYGTSETGRRRRYRNACLVRAGADPKFWEDFWEDLKNSMKREQESGEAPPSKNLSIGNKETFRFNSRISGPVAPVKPTSQGQTPTTPNRVDVEGELMRVAQHFGVQVEDLFKKRRNFPPRLAVYYHLVENCGIRVNRAASALGVSPSSVSKGIGRIKRMMEEDENLRNCICRLNQQVRV